tara:strand:- start:491 stop:2221 length:1731 start_codon:yes stop_codon:yes gene_type:complete
MQHESVLATENGVSENLKDLTWYDKSVPCRTACPADTDIPGYLEAIYQKDFDKAYQINLEDNIFPEILGRVCSRPCEDACRHGDDNNGNSLAICFSKRAAGDYKSKNKKYKVKKLSQSTKKSIAIIGAGVAGLACARELSRFGHNVHVFEKHKSAGGMLNQGIPIFRLPRNVIKREIDQIIDMGVNITYNQEISSYEDLQKLSKKFDAVVLAMGTLKPNKIDKSFTCNEFVEDGLDFLLRINEFNSKKVGQNVVVIGGGYTSMDCSRTAIRLGAKSVRTFYRRDIGDLEILPGELDELKNEDGRMIFSARPNKLITKKNKLIALELIKTKINSKNKLVDIIGSKFRIKTDHIILAIGQKQDTSIISDITKFKLKLRNSISNNKLEKNVFVAGDYALGATTLIDAIGHAKKTAIKIDKFLMGRDLITNVVKIQDVKTTSRSLRMNYIPLHDMSTLNIKMRTLTKEVEIGFNKKNSTSEASRCYLCHYKFEINNTLCVLCDECLLVKPVKDCIIETEKTLTDIDGDTKYAKINATKTNGIYHGKLYIDHKKCIRCGECERVCPTNAISIQKIEKVSHA